MQFPDIREFLFFAPLLPKKRFNTLWQWFERKREFCKKNECLGGGAGVVGSLKLAKDLLDGPLLGGARARKT